MSVTDKRRDEDYDEQVEETLQDEVNYLISAMFSLAAAKLRKLNKALLLLLPPQDENDVYILTKVSDILHAVFRSYKEKVLPWFEQLLQLVVQLIVSTSWFLFPTRQ